MIPPTPRFARSSFAPTSALVAAFLLTVLSPAWAQDLPPAEAKAMLGTLRALKEKQAETAKTGRSKLIQDFSTAASSNANAINFYEEAVRATQFDGKNRENTQFREWRKKEDDRLKSREMQNAVRLQLNYLVLTLRRSDGAEMEELVAPLLAHCQQVLADPAIQDQPELKKPISNSIFVKWYDIANRIKVKENWEPVPGDVNGIYEKAVLPVFRKTRDPRLIEYWNGRIEREATAAARSSLAFNAAKFAESRKPVLLWSRAQDMLLLGQKSQAVNEMFNLIKSYSNHPEAAGWIARLEGLLTSTTSATETGAPKPSAPPAVKQDQSPTDTGEAAQPPA